MSGGVGYVYQLRADHVNREALEAEELKLLKLDESDELELRELLTSHQQATGSPLASKLLSSFDETVRHFTKVVPSDFANVLEIRARAVSNGIDPDSEPVWIEILEATNG
jgi:glutamate synthase (NADPH/NADH) large chain